MRLHYYEVYLYTSADVRLLLWQRIPHVIVKATYANAPESSSAIGTCSDGEQVGLTQLSQRDLGAGWVSFDGLVMAKSGRLELVDNILRTLWVYLQPL